MVVVDNKGSVFVLQQFRSGLGGCPRAPSSSRKMFVFLFAGSAKCFNNLINQLLFFNCCFSIVVLQLCFANVCLQLCFEIQEVLTVVKAR